MIRKEGRFLEGWSGIKKCNSCNKNYEASSGIQKYCRICFSGNKQCKTCQKNFIVEPSIDRGGRQFCSKTCFDKWQSIAKKDSTRWKFSRCLSCNKVFEGYIRKKRQFCSNSCKMRDQYNSNWKGGITPLTHQIRESLEYKEWRKKCMERDNYICQMCNRRGDFLHIDHIELLSNLIKESKIYSIEDALNCKELWNLDNGRTLCLKCHFYVTFKREMSRGSKWGSKTKKILWNH